MYMVNIIIVWIIIDQDVDDVGDDDDDNDDDTLFKYRNKNCYNNF